MTLWPCEIPVMKLAGWKRYCKQMTMRCPLGIATVPSTQFYVTGITERSNRTPLDHISSIWETSFHRGGDWQRKTDNETVPHTYALTYLINLLNSHSFVVRSIDRSTQLIGEAICRSSRIVLTKILDDLRKQN